MKRLWILGLTLVLTLMADTQGALAGDPDLVFHTLRTEHFNIHYHQGLEPMARQVASLCEEIHSDLTVIFGWEVEGPTEVVITDSTDSSNGSASVYGRPVMRLYATAPTIDSTLQAHDHWMRTLITHEYTHIVHLSIRGRVAEAINSVLGDVYNPNQIAPNWLIEGIAVLMETRRTSVGRLRSSLYRMYVRTAALDDVLPTLGQLSNSMRSYHRGSNSYIFGSAFMQYVADKYGMEKIVELCHHYGKSILPYGVNRAFEETFGQGVISLYDEWVSSVKQEAKETIASLSKQGMTQSRAVTFEGESKGPPVFADDDESVYMAEANGWEEPSVFRVPLNGAKPTPLFWSGGSTRISIDRNKRIFYTRPAPHRNLYYFNDLFFSDTSGAMPVRLTDGLRAMDVAVSPRGDRLAVVVNRTGTSRLLLTDDRGRELETLIDSARDDQVYEPIWSPDGRRIAVLVRRGAQVDVALIDLALGTVRFLTDDRHMESGLAFDPTGRYLVFASDRTGISNLFAFDFEDAKLLGLTNVASGAYYPTVSKSGENLAFLMYSSKGYDLHVMPFEPKKAKAADSSKGEWLQPKESPPPFDGIAKLYNPFPTFLPTYWMLNTNLDAEWNLSLQAATAFSDIASRHHLGTQINYDTESHLVSGRLGYAFTGLGPGVHFGLSRQFVERDSGYTTDGEDRDWLQSVTRGSVGLSFPIFGVHGSHGLGFSYNIVHAKPYKKPKIELDPRGEMPVVPTQYFRAGLAMGWSYTDAVSSPYGIGPHKGRHVSADIELDHPALGGDQKVATFHYGWIEYLKMPWLQHHVLSLNLNGGVSLSDPPNQVAFSVGGYTEQNMVDAIINNTSPGTPTLRGYPPGHFQGSRMQSVRLNYRFPIWFAEIAYGTVPLFLKNITASAFTDNVIISYDDLNRDDWRSSVGASLAFTFAIGYYQEMRLSTGYARGLMGGGIHEFILVLGGGL